MAENSTTLRLRGGGCGPSKAEVEPEFPPSAPTLAHTKAVEQRTVQAEQRATEEERRVAQLEVAKHGAAESKAQTEAESELLPLETLQAGLGRKRPLRLLVAHVEARGDSHPKYKGKRLVVPDEFVPWNVSFMQYAPADWTDEDVLRNSVDKPTGGKWADSPCPTALEERITFAGDGEPKPLSEAVFFDDWRPLNPAGRTGLRGRGLLGLWGPNPAADPIVTRRDPKRDKLQLLAVKRADTGQWAIPGGMVCDEATVSATLCRVMDEALARLEKVEGVATRKRASQQLDALLQSGGKVVFRGYVDDPRNTDNAWTETTASHFACPAELASLLPFDGHADVAWIDVDAEDERYRNLYGGHRTLIDRVASDRQDVWTTAQWLASLSSVVETLAHVLLGGTKPVDELVAMRALGKACERGASALADHLADGQLIERLAKLLLTELRKLDTMTDRGVLHSKFVQEGKAFTLKYGDLSTFFGGLEAKIGAPDPNVRSAMAHEHTGSADSFEEFCTSNYNVMTTPQTEWWFVVEPELPIDWPVERELHGTANMRKPLPLEQLRRRLREINNRLKRIDQFELVLEEAFGARLYTGPMFIKYNAVLRGFGEALDGCKGNTYVTTQHAINSAIVKLSKLTRATKIYRGVSGGVLPEEFWRPNPHNVRGGIEPAFMSTTFDRDVAMAYALDAPGKSALIFEMQMGMVDRGAELGWVSQYPHEAECVFAPLTGIEVLGMRTNGALLVIEARLSVNLNALTIEQVVAKMKRAHLDLVHMIRAGLVQSDVPPPCLRPLDALSTTSKAKDGAWFNTPANFQAATAAIFEARAGVFDTLKMRTLATWPGMLKAATMCAREGEHTVAIELLKRASLDTEALDEPTRLARWMVRHKLEYPWPGTFVALKDARLVREVEPLIADDQLVVGKRILAYNDSLFRWEEAVVTHVGDTIEAVVGGHTNLYGLPRTKALVISSSGAGALLRAASAGGHVELIDALLEMGVSPFVADEHANTALHVAAASGHEAVCRRLLKAGLLSNVWNKRGQTATDLARQRKFLTVLRLFIPAHSDKEFTDAACEATPRLRAAACGDLEVLERTTDEGKVTALMVACRARQRQAGLFLLLTSDVDAQSRSGITALYLAAEEGDEQLVDLLLRKGADVSIGASDGSTCLHRACYFGHDLCARALIENGSNLEAQQNDGWTALMLASLNGHIQVARALIEAKANVDHQDVEGWTALMWASYKNHDQVARALIEARANLDHQNDEGYTALMWASFKNHDQVAQALIENGAHINRAKADGWVALMYACQNGHDQVTRALLEAGANPNLANDQGVTALMLASNDLCACALIEAKVNLEAQQFEGFTALMLASQNGHDQVARTLLEAGANANMVNAVGVTALIKACENGHDQVARTLLEAGVVVDQVEDNGWTALMFASLKGHEMCVSVLIEWGASTNAVNTLGFTPLALASSCGHHGAVQLLREAGASNQKVHLPDPATSCLLSFGTVGQPDLLQHGQAYYELTFVVGAVLQIGWAEPGFAPSASKGVGDDVHSWGADGIRQVLWHAGKTASSIEWQAGDVIGCAVDVKQGSLWFGCNGDWKLGFEDYEWPKGVFPALSGSKMAFALNRPARFGGPTKDFQNIEFNTRLQPLHNESSYVTME